MDVRNAMLWLGQDKVQWQQYVLHHCTFVHSQTLRKPGCPTLVKLKLPTGGYELFLARKGSHVFQAICDQHHLLGAWPFFFLQLPTPASNVCRPRVSEDESEGITKRRFFHFVFWGQHLDFHLYWAEFMQYQQWYKGCHIKAPAAAVFLKRV